MVELTEMATLNLTISDSETSDGIPDQKIILQSLDGLGTIKMPATSETGFTSTLLVPGNWSVSHDAETSGVRILVQETHIDRILAGEHRDVF